jgi:hypothetical protein
MTPKNLYGLVVINEEWVMDDCCKRYMCGVQGSGPTGRNKQWMIRCSSCHICGKIYPKDPDKLTYEQRDWVIRWNRRKEKEKEHEIAC